MMRTPGEIDWKFRQALAETGTTQVELGKKVGISHVIISLYGTGRWVFTEAEKTRIARVLKMPPERVFTDF